MTGIADSSSTATSTRPGDTAVAGPLNGIRVVTLTQAWAGTYATQLLAHMGAEVIQIEARQRPDVWRGGYSARVPAALSDRPTAEHGWNLSPLYNAVNLGKQAITLDLSHELGKSLFRTLVRQADVVAENFSPRVMGNLGFGYDELIKLKSDLILVSLSAYGTEGPYANYPGIGGTIEAMSGMTSLLGYEGGEPLNSGLMYPDPVAGYYGAAAVVLALLHRKRTGKGQHVTLSMQEACTTFIGDAFMHLAATGEVPPRRGNHHPTLAPHNIYPCSNGTDWIAIAATDDAQFRALCDALGLPRLPADEHFATNAVRKENEAELDALIAAQTRSIDGPALERQLRAASVPSSLVARPDTIFRDPVLHERGAFTPVHHPEAGSHLYPVGPWKFGDRPRKIERAAPCLGQHSREVLARLCGVDDEEYERLVALGITGEGPPE